MKYLVVIGIGISSISQGSDFSNVKQLAVNNGFNPSDRVIKSIINASKLYKINALELAAIGIVETGLGKYAMTRVNKNGTLDHGLFQINTVNVERCIEFNLDSPEGSTLCAAKLLSQLRKQRNDYLGVYHSKTRQKKEQYMNKIHNVLAMQ